MKYIISILLLSFALLDAKIIQAEQLFNKKVTKVKKEQVSITKEFYGNSAIIENNIIDIVSRFDGYIIKLYANNSYMHIKKNQTLFSIYSDEINNISQELKVAKNINKNLYSSTLSKLEVLDISKKEIKKIEKTKNFKSLNIYSPSNAIILKKSINDKSFVKKGKLLLQLANIDKLWVIAKIYQKDLGSIKKGQKVKVYFDGINTPIKSIIDFIYPIVDEKTKTVDVRFTIDNKDKKIFPNMFAKIKVQISDKEILTLPKTAILNKASKYYVFQAISKSEFEPIEVEVTRISSNKYQILEGLEEGQEVINNALFLLDSDAVTNGLYDADDNDW